jgi:hypothetical protein
VHLLMIYPPKLRLSELFNSRKGVSSRRLNVEFPATSTFWSERKSKRALCSPSYFVGGLAAPLLRSLGSTSRTKGALNLRHERRGPSRHPVEKATVGRALNARAR